MKFPFAALVLGCLSINVAAEYIDEQQKQIDLNKREFVREGFKACSEKSFETVGAREECTTPVLTKAEEKFPGRGTDIYAKQTYSGLTESEAIAELKSLHSLYKKVEDNFSNQPGVITQDDLNHEGWWIQENILGIPSMVGRPPWFKECDGEVSAEHGRAEVEFCSLYEEGEAE
ncbi:hypothetical protein RE428_48860 (plasmid) [Marinobacter nanhaiticus D15-8W]|uniref:Uncharacterized protein n=1 Tax=Marinobacter nanhaiticus D15-8W TaxID=626887 RepID=N6W3M6_9GAMM|nr:hypothetical protein [Marinobacter nanhaiticus]ENO17140.1 hypothetical protein J057_00704 [Marinobacter nanhaiticus D15-8W]BES73868.1 hypothetical protein RE428_48860 [Marinobacter nanhaiticus D15-8W]